MLNCSRGRWVPVGHQNTSHGVTPTWPDHIDDMIWSSHKKKTSDSDNTPKSLDAAASVVEAEIGIDNSSSSSSSICNWRFCPVARGLRPCTPLETLDSDGSLPPPLVTLTLMSLVLMEDVEAGRSAFELTSVIVDAEPSPEELLEPEPDLSFMVMVQNLSKRQWASCFAQPPPTWPMETIDLLYSPVCPRSRLQPKEKIIHHSSVSVTKHRLIMKHPHMPSDSQS